MGELCRDNIVYQESVMIFPAQPRYNNRITSLGEIEIVHSAQMCLTVCIWNVDVGIYVKIICMLRIAAHQYLFLNKRILFPQTEALE